MAALILAHEAKADPHSQYFTKSGGVIGKQDSNWASVLAATARVVDVGNGTAGGLAIESYQPMIYFIDRTPGQKSSRARYDNSNWHFDYDSAGNYTFGTLAARIALDGAQTSFVPGIFVAGRQTDDGTGAKIQAAGHISAAGTLYAGATAGARAYVAADANAAYFYGEKTANYGTASAQPVNLVTNSIVRATVASTGELLVGATALDGTAAKLQVAGYASFDTPPVGDSSRRGATTEFVSRLVRTSEIGAVRIEIRTSVRAGYLKLNGALVNRADYPELWAYAQASGALVTEAQWAADSWGCFGIGDGQTTFRLPEWRGEGLRFLDDGRGVDTNRAIGTYQADQNKSHAHTATAADSGSHTHGAWTDAQGYHNHGGSVAADGYHNHMSGISRNVQIYGGGGPVDDIGENMGANPIYTSSEGYHSHGVYGDGSHAHNVYMSAAGVHTHTLTIAANGGAEARMRNISALAMIRAF
ncbi:phage tail protein [Cupriavidus pauculus]|uniref:phage tail protein n=1 Tax=Cupriavidus pauculus TaxID=82633 RepID=UPI001D0C4472|nr:phage tail protein [Cupriavidus pauculus]